MGKSGAMGVVGRAEWEKRAHRDAGQVTDADEPM